MAQKPISDIKLLVEHSEMGHIGKLVWVIVRSSRRAALCFQPDGIFMKEKIKRILIKYRKTVLIILIAIGLFYWFQIRPSHIYSSCHRQAIEGALKAYGSEERYEKDAYELYYKQCLREKGISK